MFTKIYLCALQNYCGNIIYIPIMESAKTMLKSAMGKMGDMKQKILQSDISSSLSDMATSTAKAAHDASFYNPMKCDFSVFSKCNIVTYYVVGMIVVLLLLFVIYATQSSRIVLLLSTSCHLLIFVLCTLILIHLCNTSAKGYYSYAVIGASVALTMLVVFIFNTRKKTIPPAIPEQVIPVKK